MLKKIYTGRLERVHFNEVFSLHSEAHSLMARKHFLLDRENARLTSLNYNFGELFLHDSKGGFDKKILHKLVPDFPSFVEEHGTAGLFSEKGGEGLHHEINLDAAQLPCVRSDPKRLQLVVEEHEQ